MSRNNFEYCECCGAKLVEYKHSLSKSLLRALVIFMQDSGGAWMQLKDTRLSHNQRCNFPKLRYWGIIDKVTDPDGKGVNWAITKAGWAFLEGRHAVCKHAWTFRGEWIRGEGEALKIDEITGGWKYRPEYAAEALPHVPRETSHESL